MVAEAALAYDPSVMTTLTAAVARAQLHRLIDRVAESDEPIRISGPRGNAILFSEKGWNAIQETLSLLPIPGIRDSVRKGLRTSVDKCATKPGW